MIYTSRSQYNSFDECNRKAWLSYYAPNGTEGVKGWQRRAWAIPLATGAWVHNGIAGIIRGETPHEAALAASDDYRAKMTERGLESVGDMTHTIEEQSRLIEALVYTFGIIRWPQISNEFESVLVKGANEAHDGLPLIEREGSVQISDDITFQFRCDWVARRRADGRCFVFNWKTSAYMDERWIKAWDYDAQVLTESWGVQQAFGIKIDGVIIEGLYKGRREKIKDADGTTIGERQVSPLLGGWHKPDNPPLEEPGFTHKYTRAKGWNRFSANDEGMPTIKEWIDQLPRDVLEAQFTSVPPVYRDDERTMKKLTQITSRERRVAEWASACTEEPAFIDNYFQQNERSCLWPSKCSFLDACWTRNVAQDMEGSGLYMPRQANHPQPEAGGE